MLFNPIEFDGIKIRNVINSYPDKTKKFSG